MNRRKGKILNPSVIPKIRFSSNTDSVRIAYARYLLALVLNNGDFRIIKLRIIPSNIAMLSSVG